jgi:hypothetical protein
MFLFPIFRVWAAVIVILTVGLIVILIQNPLEKFNHSPPYDGVSAYEMDHELNDHFKDKAFQCRNAGDYTPVDSDESIQAFDKFVQYVNQGSSARDFWMEPTNQTQREELLEAAISAGSWKAHYINAMWTLKTRGNNLEGDEAVSQLEALAAGGIPIAAYMYSRLFFGKDPAEEQRMLSEAVDRGSPEAMAMIGEHMVIRSKSLRSVGKSMLDCALAQGYSDAYRGLGKLADMEGRWVDAYRLWEKGANSGCDGCVRHMEDFAKVRVRPAQDEDPALLQIKKFYASRFLYRVSLLREFNTPLPKNMAFQFTDGELVKLLKLQQLTRRGAAVSG